MSAHLRYLYLTLVSCVPDSQVPLSFTHYTYLRPLIVQRPYYLSPHAEALLTGVFCNHSLSPVLCLTFALPLCFASWAPNPMVKASNASKILTGKWRCTSKPKSTPLLLSWNARASKPLVAHPPSLLLVRPQALSAHYLLGSAFRHTLTHGTIIPRHHPRRAASIHRLLLHMSHGLVEVQEDLRSLGLHHHQHRISSRIISHLHLPLHHQQMIHVLDPSTHPRAHIHCERRNILGSRSHQLLSKTICRLRSDPCPCRTVRRAPVLEQAILREP